MDTKGFITTIIVSLISGAIAGYLSAKLTAGTTAKTQPKAATKSTAVCIESKLGKEKAAAIAANPKLATAEDNFKILPCYAR